MKFLKKLVLTGYAAKQAACRAIMQAPDGLVFTLAEPGRTNDQNALLWPLLECFSEQVRWPVNGQMAFLEAEEWKDLLSAAFEQDVRVAEGLNGGQVMLGRRTSQFSKKRFSEFIEFILAEGAQRGVQFEQKRQAA